MNLYKLKFIRDNLGLTEKYIFNCFTDNLYKKDWVVYCKPSFNIVEHILEYLGRYTHRVAISK